LPELVPQALLLLVLRVFSLLLPPLSSYPPLSIYSEALSSLPFCLCEKLLEVSSEKWLEGLFEVVLDLLLEVLVVFLAWLLLLWLVLVYFFLVYLLLPVAGEFVLFLPVAGEFALFLSAAGEFVLFLPAAGEIVMNLMKVAHSQCSPGENQVAGQFLLSLFSAQKTWTDRSVMVWGRLCCLCCLCCLRCLSWLQMKRTGRRNKEIEFAMKQRSLVVEIELERKQRVLLVEIIIEDFLNLVRAFEDWSLRLPKRGHY
jgi:hypothetical protein